MRSALMRAPRRACASRLPRCAIVVSLLMTGCAAIPPTAEMSTCLQPNRRVDVEVSGTAAKPPQKPQVGLARSGKPPAGPIIFQAVAQGDGAFDFGGAVLKKQGTSEFDQLATEIAKRHVQVGSIVVVGHTDKLEAERFAPNLSEDRAKAVVAYLAAKGMDPSLMYWEGKGANAPLPVTQFCE